MGPALYDFRPNLGMTSLKNVRCGLVIGVSNHVLMWPQAILPQVLNPEVKRPTKQGYGHSHINGKMHNFGDFTQGVVYFGYQWPWVWCAHTCQHVWVEHWGIYESLKWCLTILTFWSVFPSILLHIFSRRPSLFLCSYTVESHYLVRR